MTDQPQQHNASIYNIQLEKHEFAARTDGPHLVIAARIHGDEPSGEIAARRVIRELNDGSLALARGTITLLPVLNPLAKDLNVRGVWGDTNRDVTSRTEGSTPEHDIRRTIASELIWIAADARRQHQPWHLLDLHSVPLPGKAHTILGERPDDLAFARSIGADTIYDGWRTAQLRVEAEDLQALGTTHEAHRDFTSALIYTAHEAGAVAAVCLESGQNDDPSSVRYAYNGIRNSLAHFGLTDETALPFAIPEQVKRIRFEQVLIRRDASEHLVGITADAQSVQPGQVVLKGASREVCAPIDSSEWIVAHPIPHAEVGRHCGFLAKILG